jgi:twitching motility protein PilT
MSILSLFDTNYPTSVSDLHLTPGIKPVMRQNGQLTEMTEYPVLTNLDTDDAVHFLLTEPQLAKLEQNGDIDLSRFIGADTRARINVFKQRGSFSIAIRLNNMNIRNIEELGLPACVTDMCKLNRGLILVKGPTGSGKSTTMAALVDCINKTQSKHIITIEDPIEFIFKHNKSVIVQRQIEIDTPTFAMGLKSALRQDPDVIVVGEMRDLESIATVLTAAETGHLVISSIHTTGAVKTVDRIIDVFPPSQQQQIRIQLSTVLQCVISQHLIPRADGKGRVLTSEIMFNIPAAQNLIRSEKTHQLMNVILTNSKLGMQSMDKSITDYMRAGIITDDDAMIYSADKDTMAKTISEIYPMKRRYTGTVV